MDFIPMLPILESAQNRGYGQVAFNVTSYQQIENMLEIHEALRSPAVLQVGSMAVGFFGNTKDMNNSTIEERRRGSKRAVSILHDFSDRVSIPVALHADHAKDIETIKAYIEAGFTSVMIDGSSLKYEDNVDITREVVKLAHAEGVTVEAELGVLAGVEDDAFSQDSTYTNPMKVPDFLAKTKADCLALSYGTKHGVKKGINVKLRKEIVIAAMENLRHEGIHAILVSHGSSTVPSYVVEDNNALGGKIEGAGGIPINELKEIIKCGISKINVDTDVRLAITRNIREFLHSSPLTESDPLLKAIWTNMCADPSNIDFRTYLSPIGDALLKPASEATGNIAKIMECKRKGIFEIAAALLVSFGSCGFANKIERTGLEDMRRRYAKAAG